MLLGWIFITFERYLRSLPTTNEVGSGAKRVISSTEWEINKKYLASDFFDLVLVAVEDTQMTREQLLEGMGAYILESYHSREEKKGFDSMLRCLGSTLREWLGNINEIHMRLQFAVAPRGEEQQKMGNEEDGNDSGSCPMHDDVASADFGGGLSQPAAESTVPVADASDRKDDDDMMGCGGCPTRMTAGGGAAAGSSLLFPEFFTTNDDVGDDDRDGRRDDTIRDDDEPMKEFTFSSPFLLHYNSTLGNDYFAPMVIGIVRSAANTYFANEQIVSIDLLARQGVNGSSLTTWRIKLKTKTKKTDLEFSSSLSSSIAGAVVARSNDDYSNYDQTSEQRTAAVVATAAGDDRQLQGKEREQPLILSSRPNNSISRLFPFYIAVDKSFRVVSIGKTLQDKIAPGVDIVGHHVSDYFEILSPRECEWTWRDLKIRSEAEFELRLTISTPPAAADVPPPQLPYQKTALPPQSVISSLSGEERPMNDQENRKRGTGGIAALLSIAALVGGPTSDGGVGKNHRTPPPRTYTLHPPRTYKFAGSIDFTDADDNDDDPVVAYFLVQPDIRSIAEMELYNLTIADFPKHSAQRKMIYLSENLKSETFLAEESRQQEENTQHLLEMKRMFVRYVSHEIRTPLNTVSLGLKLVQSMLHDREDKEQERATLDPSNVVSTYAQETKKHKNFGNECQVVEEVIESCDDALTILDDLLMYEKMEDGGGFVLERSDEPVLALVQSAMKSLSILALHMDVDLECTFDLESFSSSEVSEPSVFVSVDKPKLNQVLRNLLSNAIKFSRPMSESTPLSVIHSSRKDALGLLQVDEQEKVMVKSMIKKPIVSVRVSIKERNQQQQLGPLSPSVPAAEHLTSADSDIKNQYVRIEVHDSGPGISVENQAQLFHQFDPNKLHGGGGSGLGLFISKGIMDQHGGEIGAFSEGEGKGVCFFLELPIVATGGQTPSNVANPGIPTAYPMAGGGNDEGGNMLMSENLAALGSRIPVLSSDYHRMPIKPTLHDEEDIVYSAYSTPRAEFLDVWRRSYGRSTPGTANPQRAGFSLSQRDRQGVSPLSNRKSSSDSWGSHQVASSTGGERNTRDRTAGEEESSRSLATAESEIFPTAALALPSSSNGEDILQLGDATHVFAEDLCGRQHQETTSGDSTCHEVAPDHEEQILSSRRLALQAHTVLESAGEASAEAIATSSQLMYHRQQGVDIASNVDTLTSPPSPRLSSNNAIPGIESSIPPGGGKIVRRERRRMNSAAAAGRITLTRQWTSVGANLGALTTAPLGVLDSSRPLLRSGPPSQRTIHCSRDSSAVLYSSARASPQYTLASSLPDSPRGASTTPVTPRRLITVFHGRSLKVLIVDDSAFTRKMISRILRVAKVCPGDAVIKEAADGQKAVDIVAKSLMDGVPSSSDLEKGSEDKTFDLILMDFVMPVMDGPTATKQIRLLGFKGLIVGVTGNVLPEDRTHFMNQGADAVLSKPLDIGELCALLSEKLSVSSGTMTRCDTAVAAMLADSEQHSVRSYFVEDDEGKSPLFGSPGTTVTSIMDQQCIRTPVSGGSGRGGSRSPPGFGIQHPTLQVRSVGPVLSGAGSLLRRDSESSQQREPNCQQRPRVRDVNALSTIASLVSPELLRNSDHVTPAAERILPPLGTAPNINRLGHSDSMVALAMEITRCGFRPHISPQTAGNFVVHHDHHTSERAAADVGTLPNVAAAVTGSLGLPSVADLPLQGARKRGIGRSVPSLIRRLTLFGRGGCSRVSHDDGGALEGDRRLAAGGEQQQQQRQQHIVEATTSYSFCCCFPFLSSRSRVSIL